MCNLIVWRWKWGCILDCGNGVDISLPKPFNDKIFFDWGHRRCSQRKSERKTPLLALRFQRKEVTSPKI